MRAGLPGHELEAIVRLGGLMVSVLRVLWSEHPCYQLHSALDGGTGKKHVHDGGFSRLPLSQPLGAL
jgi:hypothetical protein